MCRKLSFGRKKAAAIFLASAMVCSLALTGCAEEKKSDSSSLPEFQSIAANAYDFYTDKDSFAHFYHGVKPGEPPRLGSQGIDDDITKIIPKELFFRPGDHLYVGLEYGFFLHVEAEANKEGARNADAMVFDIIHDLAAPPKKPEGSVKIVPMYQLSFLAVEAPAAENGSQPPVQRVYPSERRDILDCYFLKDIGIKITLESPGEPVPGDSGYDAARDMGAFLTETRLTVSGTGKNRKGYQPDTVIFSSGASPAAATSLQQNAFTPDLAEGFGSLPVLDCQTFSSDSDAPVHCLLKPDAKSQIEAYQGLIRSQSAAIRTNPELPRLIPTGDAAEVHHPGSGFVELKYTAAVPEGSDCDRIRLNVSISAVVAEADGSRLTDRAGAVGTYRVIHSSEQLRVSP